MARGKFAASKAARGRRVLRGLFVIAPVFFLAVAVRGAADDAKKSNVTPITIRDIDAKAAAQVSFTHDIKPILANNCFDCHAEDDRKSDLDVTTVGNLLKGGKKAGPAIVPGKPDESPMVKYIRGLSEPQMPKGNPPLSEAELHLIRSWISAGAADDSAKILAEKSKAGGASVRTVNLNDEASQRAINMLVFSGNNRERLLAQRALRLAWLPPAPTPPKVKTPVFNPIDQFIAAKWEQAKLKEATHAPPVCNDTAFARRVYLDLIGVIPTAAEAQRFLNDTAPDKRAKLVDELLARKEDYAANWTPFWEDALGSADVDQQGGIGTRGNHRQWIYQSFLENKPYDIMVAELLDPLMPGYQKPVIGESNGKRVVSAYIRNETHEDTVLSSANTAQVFLGTSMKCASCHNHFLNKEWPQSRFLAFAGMFGPKDLEVIRCEKKSGQMVPAQFPFDLPGAPEDVPRGVNERLHLMTQLLVDPANPRFAKAIVNRLWKRYLGTGLFAPVDDFRLDQPPSHPELLDWLADDFMRHGYDLKHTIRLILTSRTYQLRYDPALEDHFDVAKPTMARYFRSPSLRRMTAEELIDSIRVAEAQKLEPQSRLYLDTASTALTRALGKPASRNEISTSRPDDVAVVQALELLNGEEFNQLVYTGEILDTAAGEKDFSQGVDRLYHAALNRPASTKEKAVAASFYGKIPDTAKAPDAGPVERVWFDDELPPGAKPDGTDGAGAWRWVSAPDFPVFSGEKSHTQNGKGEQRQHYFLTESESLKVEPNDRLFAYVYLDPKDPPREIMLQWHADGWEHRAIWGEDLIGFGAANSTSRHPMGPLPKTGEWVRLEVPARAVGFSPNVEINGCSFDQYGGTVYWDKSGIAQPPENSRHEPLGDVLWALFASPEFQYIR